MPAWIAELLGAVGVEGLRRWLRSWEYFAAMAVLGLAAAVWGGPRWALSALSGQMAALILANLFGNRIKASVATKKTAGDVLRVYAGFIAILLFFALPPALDAIKKGHDVAIVARVYQPPAWLAWFLFFFALDLFFYAWNKSRPAGQARMEVRAELGTLLVGTFVALFFVAEVIPFPLLGELLEPWFPAWEDESIPRSVLFGGSCLNFLMALTQPQLRGRARETRLGR